MLAKTLLIYAVKLLIGNTDWDRVLSCVRALLDSTLEGDEKRQMAADMARALGVEVRNNLLNIAVEAAVLALKNAK